MITENIQLDVLSRKSFLIFAITTLVGSISLLWFTNEYILGLVFISFFIFLISFCLKIRIIILLLLIPFAHAGLGLDKLGGFGIFDIFSILFTLFFLFRLTLVDFFNLKKQTVLKYSVVMAIAFLPSLLNSFFFFSSLKTFVHLTISITMAYALYYYLTDDTDDKFILLLLKVFAVEAVLVSIVGIYQASASNTITGFLYGRTYFTFFGEVNYYAGYLLVSLPIIVRLIITEKSILTKVLIFFGSIIVTFAIISTVSRSAIFSLIIIALLFFLYILFRRGQRKFIAAIAISMFLMISGIIFTTDIGNKLIDFFTLTRRMETIIQGRDASVSQRQTILEIGMRMIEAHPVVGVGFGTFEENFDNYKHAELSTGYARSAHNTPLKIFAETGIIGLIASLIFIISLLYNLVRPLTLKNDRHREVVMLSLLVSIISFLIMSLTLDQLFEPHFWILSGIALAYIKVIKDNPLLINKKIE